MTASSGDRLAARIDELDAALTRLTADVDVLGLAVQGAGISPPPAETDAPVAEPFFQTVDDWVQAFYTPTFIRPIGGAIRWCTVWDRHGEALLRIEAMWRAWEVLRLDGGLGMSIWLLHHLDPGLAALTSRTGPFAQCTPDRHADHHATPAGRTDAVSEPAEAGALTLSTDAETASGHPTLSWGAGA